MATLKQQTDALLNSFASFIIAATGLPVYLYGREFTRPAGQYITLNVLSILENGTPANEMYDQDGFYSSVMNYDVRITAVCYRDNAYVPLMTLKQRIQSNSNMYDTYFPDADFGYLNSTQILRFDAPIDSVTFEERASCTFDFNISIVEVETYTSTPINTINITSTIYDQTPLDTTPVVITSTVEDPTPSIPPN